MRAVDTNILVRYVVNDDPKQAAVVENFWVECETNQEAIFIPVLVLRELMLVLSRLYPQTKPQLIAVLEKLPMFTGDVPRHARRASGSVSVVCIRR
jgi:predicted nucleic acid-binding protein